MTKKLFLLGLCMLGSQVQAAQLTCTGKLTQVGFMPQYTGKVLSINTDYRTNISVTAVSEDKADMVMSLLLSALMADKAVTIQYNLDSTITCAQIAQWTPITIERVFVNK